MGWLGLSDDGALERRLARLERQVGRILGELGIPPDEPADEEVLSLLRSGKKIEAIKTYRAKHGTGLKEAKDAVDEIERGMA